MPVIKAIVEQHAEEAAFLWLLRDAAVRAPHYSLKDLARLDERVEAHLDGLRVAADDGWEICSAGLKHREAGEVFATGVLALEGAIPERIEQVFSVIDAAPETARGLISAFGWVAPAKLQGKVKGLLESTSPLWRYIGIAACAIHRVDPGRFLDAALADDDPLSQARALRAVGELKRRDLLPALRKRSESDDEGCRFWAAWSSTMLGDPHGLGPLKRCVETRSSFAPPALELALRAVEPRSAVSWIRSLVQVPALARTVVAAAGIIGDAVAIPWLIKRMGAPDLARVAGEAFTMITGVDIAYDDLEGEPPAPFEAGPTENPEDEDVALDADEDLPWPDPEAIKTWWATHQGQFPPGIRHLLGQPIEIDNLRLVLLSGRQRQRQAAALELAVREPNAPLFETRAPGFRQHESLRQG